MTKKDWLREVRNQKMAVRIEERKTKMGKMITENSGTGRDKQWWCSERKAWMRILRSYTGMAN